MLPVDLLSVQSGSEIDIATYITEKTGRPAIGKIPKVTWLSLVWCELFCVLKNNKYTCLKLMVYFYCIVSSQINPHCVSLCVLLYIIISPLIIKAH